MATAKFFGEASKQLLGVYHPPRGAGAGDRGVLLCYPGPQEYMRTHWAFRNLADLLTRAGLHVFRFDYYGTGDSAGASDAGSVSQWLEDIVLAATELQDVAGVTRISLVGLRVGAALAALACRGRLRARELVLWEPVVDGAAYLEELRQVERTRNLHHLYPPGGDPGGELLGYPFPSAMAQAIGELNLLERAPEAVERVAVVASQARESYRALCAAWKTPAPELLEIREEAASAREGVLMSPRQLQGITDFIKRAS
ncbi:MAG TPA: alpha/beta hydrolase [Myxococcota bacterium]|nr:alpha/beta hydrolase [Myxococcota bacterium]